jgi:hypothetical protein
MKTAVYRNVAPAPEDSELQLNRVLWRIFGPKKDEATGEL